jgi:hypothetical protein
MKLFNKLYLLIFVALAFACDPYDETFQEIEGNAPGPIGNIEITLSEDDYELLEGVEGAENIVDFGNFDNDEDVREFIPMILSQKYPLFDNGSAVKVNYDFYRGRSDKVRPFTNADEFEISADGYAIAGDAAGSAQFFNNTFSADDFIPEVLNSMMDNPEDGDIIAVNYEYSSIEYDDISGEVKYSETFDAYAEGDVMSEVGFSTVSITGPQVWEIDASSSGYQYAKMSGFSGGSVPNEDWFVLPEIDLTSGSSSITLKLSHVVNFMGGGTFGEDIAVKVSEDYAGDATTATWTDLELDQWPSGSNYDVVDSEVSLADYAGQQIHIALFYNSTADFAPQWRVLDVSVEQGEAVETDSRYRFYSFDMEDSRWEVSQNVYYLAESDYDAMGAPGRFNNFSSSTPANDYLPSLLEEKYPYALAEDEKVVIYKYFSSGEVQTRGDLYTFASSSWDVYGSIVVQNLQFGKEEGAWVPDNTIAYTLSGEDYQAIGAIEIENGNEARGINLQDFGNFYQNFPGGDTHWTPEDIANILGQFLLQEFPNSEVGQKYNITYLKYVGSAVEDNVLLILTEGGTYQIVE